MEEEIRRYREMLSNIHDVLEDDELDLQQTVDGIRAIFDGDEEGE